MPEKGAVEKILHEAEVHVKLEAIKKQLELQLEDIRKRRLMDSTQPASEVDDLRTPNETARNLGARPKTYKKNAGRKKKQPKINENHRLELVATTDNGQAGTPNYYRPAGIVTSRTQQRPKVTTGWARFETSPPSDYASPNRSADRQGRTRGRAQRAQLSRKSASTNCASRGQNNNNSVCRRSADSRAGNYDAKINSKNAAKKSTMINYGQNKVQRKSRPSRIQTHDVSNVTMQLGNLSLQGKFVPDEKTKAIKDMPKSHSRDKGVRNAHTRTKKKPEPEIWCFCRDEAYGWMIQCDSTQCPFVWFHFPCVGVKRKRKGPWFCQNCTTAPTKRPRSRGRPQAKQR